MHNTSNKHILQPLIQLSLIYLSKLKLPLINRIKLVRTYTPSTENGKSFILQTSKLKYYKFFRKLAFVCFPCDQT